MRFNLLERMRTGLLRALNALQKRLARHPWDGMDDDALADEQSWHISCGLAAVPDSHLRRVPELVRLIRHAKDLHPEVAAGVAVREARGEPWPDPAEWLEELVEDGLWPVDAGVTADLGGCHCHGHCMTLPAADFATL